MITVRKFTCVVLIGVATGVLTHARGGTPGNDLNPTDYYRIERALVRGDEAALPVCGKDDCASDKVHLLRSAAFRIRWKLVDALREAERCQDLTEPDHDVTRYACARLALADATALRGVQGYWSNIGVLAQALRKGVADHVWPHSESTISNPTILAATRLRGELKKHHFETQVISYDNTIDNVPLLGDGSPKSYNSEDSSLKSIRVILNYPSIHVTINGKVFVMNIDTGSARTVLYSSSIKKLRIKEIDIDHPHLWGITGAESQSRIGVVKLMKFANMDVRNMIVSIVKQGKYTAGDGIIGLDVIDRIPALMFTRTALLINPVEPSTCGTRFTMSTDFYGAVNGIVVAGSKFNGTAAIAVLDTGNASAAVSPTWPSVKRRSLIVTDRSQNILGTLDGPRLFASGKIKGTVNYLGVKRAGEMRIGAAYADKGIDLNIGMPYFYGKNLYISFKDMKICMSH